MRIQISNKLHIHDASSTVFDWCKKELEFANPDYEKKQRMGLWTGNIEPRIVLWEKVGGDAVLPYGCLEPLLRAFPSLCETVSYEGRVTHPPIQYDSSIDLYDYQKDAVNAVYGKSGVLVMPCGSGKTQTALALAALYESRVLWVTHTQELLNQSLDRALCCYGIDSKKIGTITGGKVNIGEAITFATVQTLSKIDLTLEQYRTAWDVIIVDECHKAVGTPTKLMMFYKVVSRLYAPIKIGLTATPKRNDGMEKCMFSLLGPILYEVDDSVVKRNTVPIRVWQKKSEVFDPPLLSYTNPDGTINYTTLLNSLCSCEERNRSIAETVGAVNAKGMTCLILSDRVAHLIELRKLVGEKYTRQIFSKAGSKHARQERKECLELLKDRQISCLFATYQLAKEGLDIPSLDCVVFATPKKDQITIVQSCGRVGRRSPGKEFGTVIDIVDSKNFIFDGYGKKRKSLYKNKKYIIL